MTKKQRKTALVTGGAKRLGKAIVAQLAAAETNVIIHYNQSGRSAEALQKKMIKEGVAAWTLQADLADPAAGEELLYKAMELVDKVDILVNSASVFPAGEMGTITYADLEKNIQINAWAPLALSRAFALQAENGVIINLLDTRVRGYDRKHAAYYLSKKMLEVLTTTCALDFAPTVRVNAVAPGLVLPPVGADTGYLETLAHTNPLNTHGAAADVASAVQFLIESSFVTGQTLYVDGGRHLLGVMR